jgi:putative ABC transport system permease protein
VHDGELQLSVERNRKHPAQHWTVPAVTALPGDLRGAYLLGPQTAFISVQTAADLGFVNQYAMMLVRTDGYISNGVVDRLQLYGLYGWTEDPDRLLASRLQYAGLAGAGLLTLLVVGIAVAMAAAESRDDVATLAAVGAGPWRRCAFGAMHGLFLGIVGSALGVGVGVPAGLSFSQLDATAGFDVPWLATGGTVVVVLVLSWVMGAVVTPSRFRLTRRVA